MIRAPIFTALLSALVASAMPTNCTRGEFRNTTKHYHHAGTALNNPTAGSSNLTLSSLTTSSSYTAVIPQSSIAVSSVVDSVVTTTTSQDNPGSTASSVTSATSSAATNILVADDDDTLLVDLHSSFRALYDAGDVAWNDTLAAYAANWAAGCDFAHTGGPYGENIAAGVGGSYNLTTAFESWADEASLYNFSDPGYSDATGHFTQIVWKDSVQIGCGWATCADGTIFTNYGASSLYLVCEYYPPGNIVGSASQTATKFEAEVGPYTG